MENWTIEEHRQELLNRINYQYRQIDGSLKFPNSEEGDFIKMVHNYLMKEKTCDKGKRTVAVRLDGDS